LSDFFALRSSRVSETVSESTCLLKVKSEDSEVKDTVLDDHASPDLGEFSECTRQSEREMKDAACNHIDIADIEEQTSRDKELQSKIWNSVADMNDSTLIRPSISCSNHDLVTKAIGGSSGSPSGGPSRHHHSTSEDPNFVENYFKVGHLILAVFIFLILFSSILLLLVSVDCLCV